MVETIQQYNRKYKKEKNALINLTNTKFTQHHTAFQTMTQYQQLECGRMPNLMAALPNIGGALCSTPQSLADAHY